MTDNYSELDAINKDAHLLEIVVVYFQLSKIYDNLNVLWQENENPLCSILCVLLDEADKIEPKTLSGCAAKLALTQSNADDWENQDNLEKRLLGSATISARQVISHIS